MRLARLEDSILNQEIEVSADPSRSQGQPLPYQNGGRWAIFQDGSSDRVAGADLIDFHNSIVS
jgi:hypothetical protein